MNEEVSFNDVNEGIIPTEEVQETEPQVETPEQQPDELPPKYRGKSVQDLIQMVEDSQKEIGRKGNELGQLRKLVDEHLKAPTPPKQVEDIDFFENPKAAIDQHLQQIPELKQLQEFQAQQQVAQVQNQLKEVHPDFMEVVQSPEFLEWVQESPIRLQLLAHADQRYDFYAANELLGSFKAQKVRAQLESTAQTTRRKALGNTGKGVVVPEGKKTYSRADLIKLQMTNPTKYMEMHDEILQAYADGRVK